MIDKEYSGYLLVCDVCDHQVKYFDNFQDAVDYKKENDWSSRKENGEWLDICPECQELINQLVYAGI